MYCSGPLFKNEKNGDLLNKDWAKACVMTLSVERSQCSFELLCR